jgi:hypothetical protein
VSLRLSTSTKLTPEQAINRAVRYFADELGLTVVWRSAVSARLDGGGGYVQVSAVGLPNSAEVELETMEWEFHVRQFASGLPH